MFYLTEEEWFENAFDEIKAAKELLKEALQGRAHHEFTFSINNEKDIELRVGLYPEIEKQKDVLETHIWEEQLESGEYTGEVLFLYEGAKIYGYPPYKVESENWLVEKYLYVRTGDYINPEDPSARCIGNCVVCKKEQCDDLPF